MDFYYSFHLFFFSDLHEFEFDSNNYNSELSGEFKIQSSNEQETNSNLISFEEEVREDKKTTSQSSSYFIETQQFKVPGGIDNSPHSILIQMDQDNFYLHEQQQRSIDGDIRIDVDKLSPIIINAAVSPSTSEDSTESRSETSSSPSSLSYAQQNHVNLQTNESSENEFNTEQVNKFETNDEISYESNINRFEI